MKALKFLSVFLFSLAMVGCFHVSAYAAEVETDSDYIFLSPEEISMEDVEQSTLIASQTFTAIFDENGGLVDVIEGDLPAPYANSDTWGGTSYTATVQFSKSEIANRYYVGLRGTASGDFWFSVCNFRIRPKGTSSWTERENKYTDKPTSVYEMIGFIYEGSEDDVGVDVKGYFRMTAPGWTQHLDWPSVSLDNPY